MIGKGLGEQQQPLVLLAKWVLVETVVLLAEDKERREGEGVFEGSKKDGKAGLRRNLNAGTMTGKGRELADMMDTIIRARDQMEGKEDQKKQRLIPTVLPWCR